MARRYHPWYGFILSIARVLVFRLSGGLRVIGSENVPKQGPLIVSPNHTSNLDPPAAAVSVGRQITFMAKADLFNVPILGPLIRSLGAFPVKRGTADTEALRLTYKLLEEGRAVLVFPEGTRGDGKRLLTVSRGIAMIARRSNAPVIPVGIVGNHKKMPKGRPVWGFGRTTVSFGKPMRFEEFIEGRSEKEAGEAFAAEWVQRVLKLCGKQGMDLLPPEEQPMAEKQGKGQRTSA